MQVLLAEMRRRMYGVFLDHRVLKFTLFSVVMVLKILWVDTIGILVCVAFFS